VKPRLSCLDRRFKYRDSANTDIRETWARARRREQLLRALAAKRAKRPAENVVPLKKTASE